jgi:hypothetical protein
MTQQPESPTLDREPNDVLLDAKVHCLRIHFGYHPDTIVDALPDVGVADIAVAVVADGSIDGVADAGSADQLLVRSTLFSWLGV